MTPVKYHERPFGVGLAYHSRFHESILAHHDQIDLLEISTTDHRAEQISQPLEIFPSVTQGHSLSSDTIARLNNSPNTFSPESNHTIFLPFPFEATSIQEIKQHYYAIRRCIGDSYTLENGIHKGSRSEAQFLAKLTEETDCNLLLDMTSVIKHAEKYGSDPFQYFDAIPMDRVSQIHIEGGATKQSFWPLFKEALEHAPYCEIVILGRGNKISTFEALIDDVQKAREIFFPLRQETSHPVDTQEMVPKNQSELPCSLLAGITSEAYREFFASNVKVIPTEADLHDTEWLDRLIECDPAEIETPQDDREPLSEEDESQ